MSEENRTMQNDPLETLRYERDQARARILVLEADLEKYAIQQDDFDYFKSRCAALELALKKYGEHTLECHAWHDKHCNCACGFEQALSSSKLGDLFQGEELLEAVAKAIEQKYHEEGGVCDERDGGPDKCWKSMKSFAKAAVEALRKEVGL